MPANPEHDALVKRRHAIARSVGVVPLSGTTLYAYRGNLLTGNVVDRLIDATITAQAAEIALDLDGLNAISQAVSDILGYLGDNSCGDPDCCGGPYYERADFDSGVKVFERFGLTVSKDVSR